MIKRRPILNTNTETKLNVSHNVQSRTNVQYNGIELEKRLRQKRSTSYVEAMTKLDAGGVQTNTVKIEELIETIKNEFPDLHPIQFPIGIISKCYLGAPYEVHTLDVTLDIIEHYKKGEPLPAGMDRARSIALHPSYAFIEVYTDTLCAVNKNGEVSIIKG